jgi:hypothetical protein
MPDPALVRQTAEIISLAEDQADAYDRFLSLAQQQTAALALTDLDEYRRLLAASIPITDSLAILGIRLCAAMIGWDSSGLPAAFARLGELLRDVHCLQERIGFEQKKQTRRLAEIHSLYPTPKGGQTDTMP